MDVSIVNWINEPSASIGYRRLDGKDVGGITAALRSGSGGVEVASRLIANRGRAFQGFVPGGNYLVSEQNVDDLLSTEPEVVRPFLSAEDIAKDPLQQPSRYVIDFGVMPLEEAMTFPRSLEIVRSQAKDFREGSRSYSRNPHWWQFLWPRPVFRRAVGGKHRYIAGTRVGKRILFCWCDSSVAPADGVNVFALSGDDALGVLTSRAHLAWAQAQSSTLENRIRYTPSSAFETFPWPSGELDVVAEISYRLCSRRGEICLQENIGLTKLYNQVDDGAWTDLRDLHVELDEAVAVAYGWPTSVAHDSDESNRRLLELNRAIAAGEIEYDPFPS